MAEGGERDEGGGGWYWSKERTARENENGQAERLSSRAAAGAPSLLVAGRKGGEWNGTESSWGGVRYEEGKSHFI